jgi:hypothetical protein
MNEQTHADYLLFLPHYSKLSFVQTKAAFVMTRLERCNFSRCADIFHSQMSTRKNREIDKPGMGF